MGHVLQCTCIYGGHPREIIKRRHDLFGTRCESSCRSIKLRHVLQCTHTMPADLFCPVLNRPVDLRDEHLSRHAHEDSRLDHAGQRAQLRVESHRVLRRGSFRLSTRQDDKLTLGAMSKEQGASCKPQAARSKEQAVGGRRQAAGGRASIGTGAAILSLRMCALSPAAASA